jgi:hypothetical protein
MVELVHGGGHFIPLCILEERVQQDLHGAMFAPLHHEPSVHSMEVESDSHPSHDKESRLVPIAGTAKSGTTKPLTKGIKAKKKHGADHVSFDVNNQATFLQGQFKSDHRNNTMGKRPKHIKAVKGVHIATRLKVRKGQIQVHCSLLYSEPVTSCPLFDNMPCLTSPIFQGAYPAEPPS